MSHPDQSVCQVVELLFQVIRCLLVVTNGSAVVPECLLLSFELLSGLCNTLSELGFTSCVLHRIAQLCKLGIVQSQLGSELVQTGLLLVLELNVILDLLLVLIRLAVDCLDLVVKCVVFLGILLGHFAQSLLLIPQLLGPEFQFG